MRNFDDLVAQEASGLAVEDFINQANAALEEILTGENKLRDVTYVTLTRIAETQKGKGYITWSDMRKLCEFVRDKLDTELVTTLKEDVILHTGLDLTLNPTEEPQVAARAGE